MRKIDIANMNGDFQESPYLKAGIQEVTIVNFVIPEGSSVPCMEINLTNTAGNRTLAHRFYFPDGDDEDSVKNYEKSARQIKHIATKTVNDTEFNTAWEMSTNLNQLSINLSKLLGGKSLRMKLSGKEIQGKDGKLNWFKAVITGNRFAEALSVNPTKLTFDPDNQYDMKRLTTSSTVTTASEAGGLPF